MITASHPVVHTVDRAPSTWIESNKAEIPERMCTDCCSPPWILSEGTPSDVVGPADIPCHDCENISKWLSLWKGQSIENNMIS